VAERVRFEVACATDYPGRGFNLVTMFDCLHDLGEPTSTAEHVHRTLADGGTCMIVEPTTGDCVEDNLTPIGRALYAASTLICTPNALSQAAGSVLGAQAGERRIHDVVHEAGSSRFRRAAQTPFNLIFEARPRP
jgi:hypothetical protein